MTVGAGPGCVAASWGVPAVVGKTAGPGPPPAAESRTSWSMFQPVQVVGALAHGGLCPTAVWTTCGPAPSVIPLASGPQGTSCASPLSRACWADPTTATSIGRPSIDSRFETQFPGRSAGSGRPHAGDADLGDAERAAPAARPSSSSPRTPAGRAVKVRTKCEPVSAGKETGTVVTAPGTVLSAMGGRATRAHLAPGGDRSWRWGPSGGRRRSPAGEPAQRLRLGQVVGEGGADLGVRPEAGLPGRRGVAVDGGRRRGLQVAREPPRGVGVGEPGRRRRRATDQPVDLVVGDEGREAGRAREGEGAGGGQRELRA